MQIRCGFVVPYAEARDVAGLAALAERSGWDGIFVWEPVWGVDAWVSLAAAAMTTERIHLGTMLTPPSRMRPWKLASEAATVQRLCGGRLILPVGLGAPDAGWAQFGEVVDRRARAELLDESLEVITTLWAAGAGPVSHRGPKYTISYESLPTPVPDEPVRVPIWVVGAWGRARSMDRALRHDGILPMVVDADGTRPATPEEVRQIRDHVEKERGDRPFDIVVEGETPGDDPDAARAAVEPWAAAGATWWIEGLWEVVGKPEALDRTRQRLEQGPPSVG